MELSTYRFHSMYRYRLLKPDQRRAVVKRRRAMGRPWHKPPHPDLGEGWYLLSAATFEHRRHFSAPQELSALEGRLLDALRGASIDIAGWAVMPNHYHVLAYIVRMADAGRAIGPVHGRSARYANLRDQTARRQVWYKFSDRKLRSEDHYWTCLHYVVANPVKHGYASTPFEWKWSSFKNLLADRGQSWIDDLARQYPLAEFGKAWGDWDP